MNVAAFYHISLCFIVLSLLFIMSSFASFVRDFLAPPIPTNAPQSNQEDTPLFGDLFADPWAVDVDPNNHFVGTVNAPSDASTVPSEATALPPPPPGPDPIQPTQSTSPAAAPADNDEATAVENTPQGPKSEEAPAADHSVPNPPVENDDLPPLRLVPAALKVGDDDEDEEDVETERQEDTDEAAAIAPPPPPPPAAVAAAGGGGGGAATPSIEVAL